jgi:hypothetical protein
MIDYGYVQSFYANELSGNDRVVLQSAFNQLYIKHTDLVLRMRAARNKKELASITKFGDGRSYERYCISLDDFDRLIPEGKE